MGICLYSRMLRESGLIFVDAAKKIQLCGEWNWERNVLYCMFSNVINQMISHDQIQCQTCDLSKIFMFGTTLFRDTRDLA
jgi:hypothetical protein